MAEDLRGVPREGAEGLADVLVSDTRAPILSSATIERRLADLAARAGGTSYRREAMPATREPRVTYVPAADRYERMTYNRCGRSGLQLPAVSLGLWQNFGGDRPFETSRAIVRRAFDLGITHFDLANNYGPPYGSAEETFGRLLEKDLAPFRDELVISTKAGYDMWPGPYGDGGSRKYLLASLDQSLGRMGLDYVDIFYSHRSDPDTPLEETMGALDSAVRQGKALYAGISSYSPERTIAAAVDPARSGHAAADPPAVVLAAQSLDRARAARRPRRGRRGLHRLLAARAGHAHRPLPRRHPGGFARQSRGLALARPDHRELARRRSARSRRSRRGRGQTLAQMALAWTLRDPRVTSTLIGASSVAQLEDNVGALDRLGFSADELAEIDRYATDGDINLWAGSSAYERSAHPALRPARHPRCRSCWPAWRTARARPSSWPR